MDAVAHITLFVLGVAIIVWVLDAALRTFVVPRGAIVFLTALIFLGVRQLFRPFAPARAGYERRDRVMALYGPLALLACPAVSILLIFLAYGFMFKALGGRNWHNAFVVSGSSLTTLGFEHPSDLPSTFLALSAAAIGLGLLALLIAYLPTIYTAFSRREVAVTDLSIRAGTPPTPVEFLTRAHITGFLYEIDDFFVEWMHWFTELQETHTSIGVITFFRSPNPHRHWITAAGSVLDTAAMRLAAVNIPWSAKAPLCIRSGYVALREIAGFFGYDYEPNPAPDDPINVDRTEFDEAYDQLASAGVPMRPDREKAWRDFAGWRVNYDEVLIALAAFVDAPYAPWISDRGSIRPIRRYRFGRRRRETARKTSAPAFVR